MLRLIRRDRIRPGDWVEIGEFGYCRVTAVEIEPRTGSVAVEAVIPNRDSGSVYRTGYEPWVVVVIDRPEAD